MSWFDIEDCNCIFAIDSNSNLERVNGNPRGFYLTNEPETLLSPEGNDTDKVGKGVVRGVELNSNNLEGPLLTYRCLSINKNNFTFPEPKTYGTSGAFSLILRCRLKSSSKFLVRSLENQGNYGLSYTTEVVDFDYQSLWRFGGFNDNFAGVEPQIAPLNSRKTFYTFGFETVVLRLDYQNDIFKLSSRDGNFTIPVGHKNEIDIWNDTYKVLGAAITNPSWRLDADIVAFGLWDKFLSDEEVEQTLKAIDDEFLVGRSVGMSSEVLTTSHSGPGINNDVHLEGLNEIQMRKPFKRDDNKVAEIDFHKEIIKDYTVMVFKSKATTLEDIVLKENKPVSVNLYLYERLKGMLIATTISNKEGKFKFVELDPDLEYVVTAHDPEYQFKSIIKNYGNV